MKRLAFIAIATLTFLAAAPSVRACPLCKEAIPEGQEGQSDFDPAREAKGYNQSIYFMLAVPFGLCAVMGYGIYRQCRKISAAGPSDVE